MLSLFRFCFFYATQQCLFRPYNIQDTLLLARTRSINSMITNCGRGAGVLVVLVVVLAGILDVDGRVQRTHFRGRTNND